MQLYGLLNHRLLNRWLHLLHTCIFCTVTFLFSILMTWAFFLFQRRDIKLQVGTKVNVLGTIVEVLKNLSNTFQKVNHETTPPYLRDQFTTCDRLWVGMKMIDLLLNIFQMSCHACGYFSFFINHYLLTVTFRQGSKLTFSPTRKVLQVPLRSTR